MHSRRNLYTRHPLHDVFSCNDCFCLSDIFLSIRNMNGSIYLLQDTSYLNKNCRFRLLISIVSISMTWMSLNPVKARLAKISHPKPPAPITSILHWFLRKSLTFNAQGQPTTGSFGCAYCLPRPLRWILHLFVAQAFLKLDQHESSDWASQWIWHRRWDSSLSSSK